MGFVAGFMVPHPPMIVPDVGRGSEAQIEETTRAYERVAEEIARLEPDTIVITSPHSIMYADYFHISPGKGASGNGGRHGTETGDESILTLWIFLMGGSAAILLGMILRRLRRHLE